MLSKSVEHYLATSNKYMGISNRLRQLITTWKHGHVPSSLCIIKRQTPIFMILIPGYQNGLYNW